VLAFHARLSPLSLYHRFFSPVPRLAPEQLRHLVEVDYVDSMALVAQQDERIVGITHCFRYEGGYHADVSVAVEDACQGQGIGPPTYPCPRCGLEVASRFRGFRVENLKHVGWQLFRAETYVNWCGHGQEVIPVPLADGRVTFVPVLGEARTTARI